jgi:cell growth-regulating nucleolar protein
MFDSFFMEQAGSWGAAPRENGRGGFQGYGGYQARPPTRYQATGANGTPLGTPQRMSPITVTPPEPSVIPPKPIEAQPPKDSAPTPETTEIKSQKMSKSELKAKDQKVSTRNSLSIAL